MSQKFFRDGQWLTIEQIKKYNKAQVKDEVIKEEIVEEEIVEEEKPVAKTKTKK